MVFGFKNQGPIEVDPIGVKIRAMWLFFRSLLESQDQKTTRKGKDKRKKRERDTWM